MNRRTAGIALMAALVGCSLTQTSSRDEANIPRIGGGETLAPKRCALRIMIVTRPESEAALAESLWRVADEQTLDAEARRVLQANGLRVGLVTGELPADVESILATPGPQQANTQTIILPEGDQSLLDPGTAKRSTFTLFRNQNDKLVVKDFADPKGYLRVTASYEGDNSVALRITPEIHHGPVRQGWGVDAGGTAAGPQQFIIKNGQEEETLREMTCNLTFKSGQLVVLAGNLDKHGSLGDFLFGESEVQGDRSTRKVIFLWASRSELGAIPNPIQVPTSLVPIDPPDAEVPSP